MRAHPAALGRGRREAERGHRGGQLSGSRRRSRREGARSVAERVSLRYDVGGLQDRDEAGEGREAARRTELGAIRTPASRGEALDGLEVALRARVELAEDVEHDRNQRPARRAASVGRHRVLRELAVLVTRVGVRGHATGAKRVEHHEVQKRLRARVLDHEVEPRLLTIRAGDVVRNTLPADARDKAAESVADRVAEEVVAHDDTTAERAEERVAAKGTH